MSEHVGPLVKFRRLPRLERRETSAIGDLARP